MAPLEIGLCWGTVYRANMLEMIEAAARHNFPTLSFPPSLYFDCLESGMDAKAMRRRMADAGTRMQVVDAISGGLPGMASDPIAFDGRQILRFGEDQCFEMAEALEAPFVNLTHYRASAVPEAELVDAIGAIARRAQARGITIVMEFIPDTGIGSIETARRIAVATGAPNCKILLDTWHLARTGGGAADVAALPAGSIGAMQMCDRIEPPPGTPYVPMTGRNLPGEGELPLGDIVRAARANNPDLTIEIEVFSDALAAMSIDGAAKRTADAVAAWRAANSL